MVLALVFVLVEVAAFFVVEAAAFFGLSLSAFAAGFLVVVVVVDFLVAGLAVVLVVEAVFYM